MSTPLHDAGTLLLQLPTPSQANIVFCFILTVNFPDFTTVIIKGNFDFNGANTISDMLSSTTAVSIFTPKYTPIDAEDNTNLIAVTTLCIIFIILTTLVIISLVIVILRRRRKWRSGLSNQASNIYE